MSEKYCRSLAKFYHLWDLSLRFPEGHFKQFQRQNLHCGLKNSMLMPIREKPFPSNLKDQRGAHTVAWGQQI